MPLTFGQIAAIAREAAHSPGKVQQSYDLLNAILSDLCQERDFAEARGQFLFNFTPFPGSSSGGGAAPVAGGAGIWDQMIWNRDLWAGASNGGVLSTGGGTLDTGGGPLSTGGGTTPTPPIPGPTPINPWPGVQFGSGPYAMPVDYLRLSGSSGAKGAQKSFIWWLNGVPYAVIPVDLAEFDMQVQQTGLNAYVWLAATDMSAPIDDRILLETTGDVTAGSTTVANVVSTVRLLGGNVIGVAGQGIQPGTQLSTITAASAGGSLSTGGGTLSTGGGGLSTGGGAGGTGGLTLSAPALATIPGASLIFGYAPVIFVYPPPISSLQAMIRYQKQMPPITDPSRYPWMRNEGYLIKKLTGKLCGLNDDSRADVLDGNANIQGSAESDLTNYLSMIDDSASHPKVATLDRRVFGRNSRLPATKQVPAWW